MRTLILALAVLAAPALAQEQQRGYMGVQPAELTPELRTAHKIDAGVEQGLVLTTVYPDTPAAKAGLRVGDVLTAFDNKAVRSIDDLLELISATKPGQRVAYVARRGSGTIAGLMVLGAPPAESVVEEEIVEEEATPAKGGDDLDARMNKLKREMDAMRELAEKRKAEAAAGRRRQPAPQNIVGWMEREELELVAAKKAGNERAVQWHSARMQLLRQLREAGYITPSRGADQPNSIRDRQRSEQRMRMLEAQLKQVLERLERLEGGDK